jgi:hypothetical protein
VAGCYLPASRFTRSVGPVGKPNEFERAIDGVPVEMLRALGEDW